MEQAYPEMNVFFSFLRECNWKTLYSEWYVWRDHRSVKPGDVQTADTDVIKSRWVPLGRL
jgi:hypothetical protein